LGREICDSYSRGENLFLIFTETKLKGAFIIELEKLEDERGFFARSYDNEVFEKAGLELETVQCNVSFNKNKGTIHGLHYQAYPYQETKLVRCTKGKIFDVIIDLKPDSENFRKWESVELNENSYRAVYIPKGFAHGFQTLEDNTEVFYQMSEYYRQDYARGLRWDEPIFSIPWPIKNPIVSKKDLSYQFLKDTNKQ